jgi:hypothetical protein
VMPMSLSRFVPDGRTAILVKHRDNGQGGKRTSQHPNKRDQGVGKLGPFGGPRPCNFPIRFSPEKLWPSGPAANKKCFSWAESRRWRFVGLAQPSRIVSKFPKNVASAAGDE